MAGAGESLETVLDSLTATGELCEKHADGSLTCYACGHRCLIKPGRRGICRVRYNDGGELRVPWGYVGALQCDPTEKKPFFHVYPGSDTLTFGMLGCDLHCPYCFAGSTRVPTAEGVETLASLFSAAPRVRNNPDGDIAFVSDQSTYSHLGQLRPIRAVFRHPYSGEMCRIVPAFLPPLDCTPDHRFLAIRRPRHGTAPGRPGYVPARDLSREYCLAVPKRTGSASTETPVLKVADWVSSTASPDRMKRQRSPEYLDNVLELHSQGLTTSAIAAKVHGSRSRVEAVLAQTQKSEGGAETVRRYKGLVLIESDYVRLFNEHAPGIPRRVELDSRLAELLGYYCAEGCVWLDTKRRANSAMLTFSFGLHEQHLARRVVELLKELFGVTSNIHLRRTTCAVVAYKASLGLFFEALGGSNAETKRVPAPLYRAPRSVVESFLRAYAVGDASEARNGLIAAATTSSDFAFGLAWLILRNGILPSIRAYRQGQAPIEGRNVHRSGRIYHVKWYWDNRKRRCWQDDDFYYVPIRKIEKQVFDGFVYNLEVDQDHSYLPHFVAASNCQNWLVSQALRDPASELSGARPQRVDPQTLVALAKQQGAALVGSSYNEPLITSEWAVSVFREAVAAGLKCVYISNGNATREVLEYIRPYVSGYKIDLKTMSDKNYRKLGAVLQNVLDGIRMVHALGFWLEVVTLVIPGFNDSNAELMDAARFLAGLSPDIPWHVTAFHQDYKMLEPDNTTADTLIRAAEIGQEAGLRYVYAGNLPGRAGDYEHTSCPTCGTRLIERYGYIIRDYRLTAQGTCPQCGTRIPGLWTDRPETVRRHGPGGPRLVSSRINRFRSDLAR
jgi:pyruvate formate lyase activating enzyme